MPSTYQPTTLPSPANLSLLVRWAKYNIFFFFLVWVFLTSPPTPSTISSPGPVRLHPVREAPCRLCPPSRKYPEVSASGNTGGVSWQHLQVYVTLVGTIELINPHGYRSFDASPWHSQRIRSGFQTRRGNPVPRWWQTFPFWLPLLWKVNH